MELQFNIGASLIARKQANNTRSWKGTISGSFAIGRDTSFAAEAKLSFDLVHGVQELESTAFFSSSFVDLSIRVVYEDTPDCSTSNLSVFIPYDPTTYIQTITVP